MLHTTPLPRMRAAQATLGSCRKQRELAGRGQDCRKQCTAVACVCVLSAAALGLSFVRATLRGGSSRERRCRWFAAGFHRGDVLL